ncbi:hypothetical protein BGW39_007619 [Mortierella sp. 14UC]|nr:hypothetical protein BGW39_007619 [Mortierella sp. 14UC]
MASLTSLPQEIIDLILFLIAKEDYVSCVRVNKAWSALFTPYFWREVRVVDEVRNDHLVTVDTRKAIARNSQHIRTIETFDPSFVHFLGSVRPTIANLESLTIRLKNNPFTLVDNFVLYPDISIPVAVLGRGEGAILHYPRCVDDVAQTLKNNPGLRFLSLDEGCFRHADERDGFAELLPVLPTAHLERLELSLVETSAPDPAVIDPDYERLDIDTAKELSKTQEQFLALKEISITGGSLQNVRMDTRRLIFLYRCPNLEKIRLHRLDDAAMGALPSFLRFACHKLTSLEWTKGLYDMEESIEALIQSTTLGWKELRLPDMAQFGSFAWRALMEHAGTLEVLRLESAEQLESNAVLDLLCSARKLRRLEGIADRQRKRFTVGLTVHAEDAFREQLNGTLGDRSWVLGPAMEYFQIQIEGVPRPDVLYRQSGGEIDFRQPGLNPALRFDVQRWIYTQLNRMVNLQELVLGLADLSSKTIGFVQGLDWSASPAALEEALRPHIRMFNAYSLEFSLESGLGLLAGLKELRVLDVRLTAHYIGVAELEWMHTNWPKLERIRGLESDRRWSANYEEGPAAKAAVDAWMAAHPRGIGSSFYS